MSLESTFPICKNYIHIKYTRRKVNTKLWWLILKLKILTSKRIFSPTVCFTVSVKSSYHNLKLNYLSEEKEEQSDFWSFLNGNSLATNFYQEKKLSSFKDSKCKCVFYFQIFHICLLHWFSILSSKNKVLLFSNH